MKIRKRPGDIRTISYHSEVLDILDELSFQSKNQSDGFGKVMGQINESSKDIATAVKESGAISQAQLDRIARSGEEANFRLADIGHKIGETNDLLYVVDKSINRSTEEIVKQIRGFGETAIKLQILSLIKSSEIDEHVREVNITLRSIESILTDVLRSIKRPNEIQAIELADQARVNLAIGKREDALRITQRAMDYCNTSITTISYYLIVLSCFDGREYNQLMRKAFSDYINLIEFKLRDAISDYESVANEVYYFIYQVFNAVSYCLGGSALDEAERLYRVVINDDKLRVRLLSGPLEDEKIVNMLEYPSAIRELHWTVIFKEFIERDHQSEVGKYIERLSSSNSLVKNELLFLANKLLHDSGLLQILLARGWNLKELNVSDKERSFLNIFVRMQPQPMISLDDKTLLLIDRYIKKNGEVQIPESLQNKLNELNRKMQAVWDDSYLSKYKELHDDIEEKMPRFNDILMSISEKYIMKWRQLKSEATPEIEKIEDDVKVLTDEVLDAKKDKKDLIMWLAKEESREEFREENFAAGAGLWFLLVISGAIIAIMIAAGNGYF